MDDDDSYFIEFLNLANVSLFDFNSIFSYLFTLQLSASSVEVGERQSSRCSPMVLASGASV